MDSLFVEAIVDLNHSMGQIPSVLIQNCISWPARNCVPKNICSSLLWVHLLNSTRKVGTRRNVQIIRKFIYLFGPEPYSNDYAQLAKFRRGFLDNCYSTTMDLSRWFLFSGFLTIIITGHYGLVCFEEEPSCYFQHTVMEICILEEPFERANIPESFSMDKKRILRWHTFPDERNVSLIQ